jgi:NAD-dependent deacetylase
MKIVVLSGAGVSAESGISTFRDAGGLWEGHDVMDVASPEGWVRNPELVNNFYNARRRDLKRVSPNSAHIFLAELERNHDIKIVTQNVDDLHERAGSTQVLHLHGELLKVRSTKYPDLIYPWPDDLGLSDVCERGYALRPHIVWFGEAVPAIPLAAEYVHDCELLLIIGTSLQVYPAAGLMDFAQISTPIIYVDPKPAKTILRSRHNFHVIDKKATESLMELNELINRYLR